MDLDWSSLGFAFMETKHLSRSVKEIAKSNEIYSEELMECFIAQGIEQNIYQSCNLFLTSMMIKSLLQNWYIKHSKYKASDVSCEGYLEYIEQVIKKQLILN